MTENLVPKGLQGVAVDVTSIATTDSEGNLLYRGYKTVELANRKSFEEVAHLVLNGKLPDGEELSEFKKFLRDSSHIDQDLIGIMKLARETNVMDGLRSGVSIGKYKNTLPGLLLPEIAAKFPQIVSSTSRINEGKEPLKNIDGSYAENLFYLLTGKEDRTKARFLEKLLILYMEHEFNASTFALRVAASTLADPVSAVVAALSTLKGPLHGGANSEVLTYLLNFKSEEEALKYVDEKLEKKEKIMGFGHRIYKAKDPRAQFVKNELNTLMGNKDAFRYAVAIEERVWEEKHLPANLDFYAALYLNELGIDEKFYLPIFGCARVFGWGAHYKEQVADNKIIRPSSVYVGPKGLELP
ncbi:MAG: citrate/2-methylcitrate synthase [Candidatus Thermoplasmatota archaeon]|nr:citrate/2-methylcitrate synthase [Candidatus Thermoplasmatota archaeon]MCL5438062.1 citrate/2-methylcitrate synthase [Candidatus Thermoplasmatota archaeon]